jgi:hypothetical protein
MGEVPSPEVQVFLSLLRKSKASAALYPPSAPSPLHLTPIPTQLSCGCVTDDLISCPLVALSSSQEFELKKEGTVVGDGSLAQVTCPLSLRPLC